MPAQGAARPRQESRPREDPALQVPLRLLRIVEAVAQHGSD